MARHKTGEYFTLDDAIEQGHVIRVRCGSCRRAANFRPGDLATIYGGGLPALEPLFPCGDCGTTEFVRATTYYPAIVDFGEIAGIIRYSQDGNSGF